MIPKPSLFTKKNVEVVVDDKPQSHQEIANCAMFNAGGFRVTIYKHNVEQLLQKSWLKQIVTYDDVETALCLHEYGHIRYGTFNIPGGISNRVVQALYNIFEDARLEYKFSNEFPQYSLFFEISLALIRTTIKSNGTAKVDKLKNQIDKVFNLVRFGENKIKGADKAGVIESLAVVSRRQTNKDTMKASIFIANLLNQNTKLSKDELANIEVAEELLNNGQPTNGAGGSSTGSQNTAGQQTQQKAQDAFNKKKKELAKKIKEYKEQMAKREADDNSFYENSINKYKEQVLNLRNIFKRLISKKSFVASMEGELNLKKQQELYINSKTMEESKCYLVNKLAKPGADVVILRDVSGSTSSFAERYAEMTSVCLGSLEKIPGVRSMLIDFESSTEIVKPFGKKAIKSTLKPLSLGGTNVCSALEILAQQKFSNDKRICIIITDGGYNNRHRAAELIELLKKTLNIKFKEMTIMHGSDSINVVDLPREISKFIREELK